MSVDVGRQCVAAVAELCDQLGYGVYVPEKETCGPWDLLVNGMRVQVKSRSSVKEQQNRIRLRTYMGSGKAAYRLEDADVLVICWFGVWYVIPFRAICRADGVVKNGLHMPSVSEWAGRWDVLDVGRVVYSKQKCFDF